MNDATQKRGDELFKNLMDVVIKGKTDPTELLYCVWCCITLQLVALKLPPDVLVRDAKNLADVGLANTAAAQSTDRTSMNHHRLKATAFMMSFLPAGSPGKKRERRKASPVRKSKRGRRKGSRIPTERHPEREQLACCLAFIQIGLGSFDAARRALLAVKGGPITIEDVEGVLRLASAEIPLPQPYDPDDKDKGLRRLSAKAERQAKRQPPTEWLTRSSELIHEPTVFEGWGAA
jgi:hypothetical protein